MVGQKFARLPFILSFTRLQAPVSLCFLTHTHRLLTPYRTLFIASYHSILVLFLTALTSGVFSLMASNLSLPTCVSPSALSHPCRAYALLLSLTGGSLFIVTLEFIAGFVLGCVSAAVDDQKYLRVDFASGLLLNRCLK